MIVFFLRCNWSKRCCAAAAGAAEHRSLFTGVASVDKAAEAVATEAEVAGGAGGAAAAAATVAKASRQSS